MKKIFAMAIGLIIALLIVVQVSAQTTGTNPLRAIWNAIFQLQQSVANIQVIPGPQGVAGSMGPSGPVGPQAAANEALHLYDALGQDLGTLVNADAYATSFVSYLEPEGILIGIGQGPNGYISLSPTETIYFPQQYCNGLPYSNVAGYPHKALFTYTNRIYTYVNATPATIIQPISEFSVGSGCSNGSSGTGPFYLLQEITLTSILFPLVGPLQIAH